MIISSILNKLKKSKLISSKNIETNTGRVYIHGNRLENTKFKPGTSFSIYLDEKERKLTLVVDNEKGKYKVSKRKNAKGCLTPIIDLKSDKILNIFKNSNIHVDIYEDVLVIHKAIDEVTQKRENVININNLININVKNVDISLDKECNNSYMLKAVSGDNYPEQLSLFDVIEPKFYPNALPQEEMKAIIQNPLITPKTKREKFIKTITSAFAGMGGLDYSFLQKSYTKGIKYVFKLAIDKIFTDSKESVLRDYHIKSYRRNIGNHIVGADILDYPVEQMEKTNILLAGIPCNELSSQTPKKRFEFKLLPKFFDKVIEIIKHMKGTIEFFVIENSSNLLTVGRQFVDKLRKELPWFTITENKVDAYDYNSFQHRRRAIIIGSTIGEVKLIPPVLKEVKTVRMAFEGLNDSIPNQTDVTVPGEKTVEKYKLIEPGNNNKSLPEHMKNNGTFSNNCKRLSYDEPSVAISNPRKSSILHPSENRVISVREMLRLFDLPDSFVVEGSKGAKQQMVANSVPLALGKAIVEAISEAYLSYNNRILNQV